jgi:predicted Rossmann fold nucleotide-binding protein DprA/Smf involved in DNA uptake
MKEDTMRQLQMLRERRGPVPERLQDRRKESAAIRKAITEALQAEPRTVPEIARTTGLASDKVLWHLMSMVKYGAVTECELDGDYYRYALVKKEAK